MRSESTWRLPAHVPLITILNRPKLENRVCECYAVVRKEFDPLLPDEMAR